jgi:hypothetical protein
LAQKRRLRRSRLDGERDWRRHFGRGRSQYGPAGVGAEGLPAAVEERLAHAVGEQAVAPDADEAGGQDVLQEGLAEGQRIELCGLDAVTVPAVAVTEEDVLAIV